MMSRAGLTWLSADSTVDQMVTDNNFPWWRPRGKRNRGTQTHAAETFSWMAKCGYLLVARDPGVTVEEVTAGLPSVQEAIDCLLTEQNSSLDTAFNDLNPFPFFALACEKVGAYDRALEYCAASLCTDLSKAGSQAPTVHAIAGATKGRCLSALGRTADAGLAFEAAAEEAHRFGWWLYEVHALRDLKLCVLDGIGHGDHGSRRLGAVLRLLKGPADKLTPMLKGLDAAELMSLAPPDDSYRVEYLVQDSGESALRRELGSLKLKELRQRAKQAGMSAEQLEQAMDSDDPEEMVIAFLLEQHATTAQLRSEQADLAGLSLKELRKRAKAVGITAEQLETAMDGDEPEDAVIELIVALSQGPAGDTA